MRVGNQGDDSICSRSRIGLIYDYLPSFARVFEVARGAAHHQLFLRSCFFLH